MAEEKENAAKLGNENEPAPSRLLKEKEDEEKIDISLLPEMSADEIDSYIEEADPEFVKALKGISADKSLTIEQIIIDDADLALQAEIDLWTNSGGWKKKTVQLLPFLPKLSIRFKILKFKFVAWFQGQVIRFKNFLYFLATEGRKDAIGYLQKKKKTILGKISKSITTFKKLKWQTKLILFFSFVLLGGAIGSGYLAYTKKGFLHQEEQLFVVNLADFAKGSYEYDPVTQTEPYIDNARAVQNLILIQKMVVNLKPSKSSGQNPMLAAEYFVEGMSADVVVEIKDREVMIRDLMQRTLEDMEYDLVETADGKREMLSRLQKEISKVLTTGKVKNVRIKTIVIKP